MLDAEKKDGTVFAVMVGVREAINEETGVKTFVGFVRDMSDAKGNSNRRKSENSATVMR
jgi:hypothetical protein